MAGLVFVDSAHEAVFSTPGTRKYLRMSGRMLRTCGIPTSATALPYTDAQLRTLKSRFPPAHSFFAGADEFASMDRIGESMQGLDRPGLLDSMPVAVLSHGKPFPGPFAVLETHHLQGQQSRDTAGGAATRAGRHRPRSGCRT